MHFVLFKSYKFIQDLINIADCLCKEFTEKNNISIEETILTSIVEYGIIVYQYIHNVSNNFSNRYDGSEMYREK